MKWTNKLYKVLLLTPIAWWIYQIFFGDLGAQPAQTLNHNTGFMTLCYLVANLWIGILISFRVKFPSWLRFLPQERRFLGVLTFIILVGHVFLYFALEAFEKKAIDQLFTKTYLTFGTLAFLTMVILAATSNNYSVRQLGGKNWKQLHRLVYLTALLVTVHIFLIEKADLVLFAAITAPMWVAQLIRLFRWMRDHRKKITL